MDAVVPWGPLVALIEPCYPVAGNGRRPYPLAVMLRVHLIRVVKREIGHTKTRFKGLAKNTAQIVTLFALTNPYTVRKRLMALAGVVRPQLG